MDARGPNSPKTVSSLKSHLLALPRELRDGIHAIVLIATHDIYINIEVPNHAFRSSWHTLQIAPEACALMSTSKQIKDETRSMFYGLNTFVACFIMRLPPRQPRSGSYRAPEAYAYNAEQLRSWLMHRTEKEECLLPRIVVKCAYHRIFDLVADSAEAVRVLTPILAATRQLSMRCDLQLEVISAEHMWFGEWHWSRSKRATVCPRRGQALQGIEGSAKRRWVAFVKSSTGVEEATLRAFQLVDRAMSEMVKTRLSEDGPGSYD